MFKMACKIVLFSMALSPIPLLAIPGSWMPTAKIISSIIVEGDNNGKALILIEGGVPSDFIPEECRAGGNSVYNTIPLNTDKGKGMYSLALAAYASGRPVKLALSCTGTRPLISHIWIL